MAPRIVISSGHGKYVRGAHGIIDEVDEARRVVEEIARLLRECNVDVKTFHDDVSTSQNENLNRIVDFHNSCVRDLDVSVHFNAYEQVSKPMGCEVLYLSHSGLAAALSNAISLSGFINRGPKYRDDLFFLNNTSAVAMLLEICFVDSIADCEIYGSYFKEICGDLADILSGEEAEVTPEPPEPEAVFYARGACSYFGGPDDTGVDPDEGLAFIDNIGDNPYLFLPYQPEGTTGLARRLNPCVHYVAARWDYDQTPKAVMLEGVALVRATKTGIALKAFCADWGPHEDTGRVADLSPSLMMNLGIETDDEVEIIFPYE